MIIRKYGIELHRITQDDIELIRQTRNRDEIRRRMFDQRPITPKQQQLWFQSINNMFNYYFIIQYQGRKVGLIHGKNSDFTAREDEGGIYIWDASLIGTGIPAKASICFIECSFNLLRLERIFARVRSDNLHALKYNSSLGYAPCPEKGEDYYVLTRKAFEIQSPRLRRLASGERQPSPLSIDDVTIPNANQNRHLYENLPADILEIIRPRLVMPDGWLSPD